MIKRLLSISAALPLIAAAQTFTPDSFTIEFIPDTEAPANHYVVESELIVDLNTDKACYNPGATVNFMASTAMPDAIVRYRHGAEVIAEHPMSSTTWQWTPPQNDFTGYLVDIYRPVEGGEKVYGAIAVDVSSDWTRFPRYGFVATFDGSKLSGNTIEKEMAYLNRLHINGVQFQDWHWKHHWPLGGTRDETLDYYTDIANRWIAKATVKKYIDTQHAYGMKSIFYNLCFGALNDAAADGVSEQWYLFRDRNHSQKDYHGLPDGWKSDIYLVNPANADWQAYLAQRNDDVYHNFDFDGYQIDQLGNRGSLYDYYGNSVSLPNGYSAFVNAMKQRHPDKRLIMNAVGSYGSQNILGTGKMDFAYNECWGDEADYTHLLNIIKANESYTGGNIKTVFAAYINYDYAGAHEGYINTPGALLTDAVMGAIGGSHLEIGDHMLSREYFPAAPLKMDDELTEALVRYYDFTTAYENLLRGGTTADEINPQLSFTGDAAAIGINAWPPQLGAVTAYARKAGDKKVYHLLNFINADNLSWRDLDCTRPAPVEMVSSPLKIKVDKSPSKIWAASPDYHGGVPQPLEFTIEGNYALVTLPALKYWTMIVVE